jgi:pentatricopeptide repeat protein
MYSTLSILGKGRLPGPVSSVNHFIEEVRHKLSIQPNLVTYTILIDAVCRGGNLREATRLLTVLSDNGLKPDAYVWHCMLYDCGGVMDVYNKMKDEGVEPDLVTYNTL